MRLLLTIALVAACGKNTEPPPPTSGSPMAQPESGPSKPRPASGAPTATPVAARAPDGVPDEAFQLYQSFCASCHGADGTGNGPAAATLNPKPQSYADAAWQAKVTDDELKKAILEGGGAIGKSTMMPPSPQLKDKPQVVDGLVKIIRGFGKT